MTHPHDGAQRAGGRVPVSNGTRRESRRHALRIIDVTPFPRAARAGHVQAGYALDESDSGLCVSLETAVAVGALLRVAQRDARGRTVRNDIVRVAWCRTREKGRFAVGVERVAGGAADPATGREV